MCKVSVIVPFYNVEEYIEKSIKSVVEQSLEDIEIILVNDGSKDGSEEIVQKYLNMYPEKIKYLKKKNGGLSDARNYAIPYTTGKYIAFLDSDDYIEEDMYKEMYETAKIDNADVVECDYFWEYPEETIRSSGKTYKNRHDMLVNSRVVAWNKLIKREVLINSGIEFPVGLRYEDVEFFYKLIPYISSISIVKKPFVHYVQRESSISNVQNEKTADIIKILNNVIDYVDVYEPADRIMFAYELNDQITELEKSGFWLFLAIEKRIVTGGVKAADSFPTLLARVVRKDNPEITKTSEERHS